MTFQKPVFLVVLIILLRNAGFVFAQDTIPPRIENPILSELRYCTDSVQVAPFISINNIKIDEDNEGMKISIANYIRGEDVLVYNKVHGFQYAWIDYYGYLEIRGAGTEQQYEDAVKNVFYKNVAEVPTIGVRSFSISLLDADYLPQTKHFYRYVEALDITWKEARDSAARMEYYGLQGYLATITSKVENDFIWTKIDGVGWIGATDSETEGTTEGRWIWATGPEAGTPFWQGNYNGHPIDGRYSFWNSGEPNNVQKNWGADEDYAHINANPNTTPKSWNDLSNEGDGPGSQYYRAQGFVVEFGGMEGDPEVQLSAEASINVSKIAFSNQRDLEICYGESVRLNVEAGAMYRYTWTPDENINSTATSNPIVWPESTITYTSVGTLDFCTDTARFKVTVHSLPVNELLPEYPLCKGDTITLDPGEHVKYEWSTGETSPTIDVTEEGWYAVTLTNEANCSTHDTVGVWWSIIPELDYDELRTLVCGAKQQTLKLEFVDGTASTLLRPLQPDRSKVEDEDSLSPTIFVDSFGVYDFEMEITDENDCVFLDTLKIGFHNQPEAVFLLDEDKCSGYNLELIFQGHTFEETGFTWFYNNEVFRSEMGLDSVVIPLGYGETERTVGLKVDEQGCVDSLFKGVSVIPKMDFWVEENPEGCTPLQVKFGNNDVEDIASYYWDFGDGNTSDTELPSNLYINHGTTDMDFDVALTVVSTEGCENTGVLENAVTVHPIPTVDLSFDEEDCHPVEMDIRYEGSANDRDTFYWDLSELRPGEILRDPGTTKGPLSVNRASAPTVTLGIYVVSEFGCKSDTVRKQWKRKPVFDLAVDQTEGCPPLETGIKATVRDDVDEVTFYYDLGDQSTGSGDSVRHTYIFPDTKNRVSFTGTSSVTGCKDTVVYSDEIYVYPQPGAMFTADPPEVLISDPVISFINQSTGATGYEWDFDDLSPVSTEESPTHRFTEMGFYHILLSAYNDFGCLDTVAQQVAVAFDKLYPPNAFSPNAPAEEDREFRINAEGVAEEGYQLYVFNRWGEVIFRSQSQHVGWDGKMRNGNYAPAGGYTWVLQYNDFRGKKHKQQGTVTLIF